MSIEKRTVINQGVTLPPNHGPDPSGEIEFSCQDCGIKLSVNRKFAGISGPCPSCGKVISAPERFETESPIPVTKPLATEEKQRVMRRSKRRIMADSNVDHQHLERRETAKTLFILTLVVLVICLCLAVSWFLNVWVRN